MGDQKPVSDQLFHILLSLVDEPRHGYGIIQEVGLRCQRPGHPASHQIY